MYLLVGLGNPGKEYENTRHNAGFIALDAVARELGVTYWKTECGALVARAVYHDIDVILVKPQSFMNTSGGPVKKISEAYGIDPDETIVIHDDLDIASGNVRVKLGGGHAGHNGLRSLCDKLGTRNYYRIRIGIGRPPGRMDTADYVLSAPRKDELTDFEYTCTRGAQATLSLIDGGIEAAQQTFNEKQAT